MRMLTNANTLDVSSASVSKKLEIEFTGKICQILSASLYNYKEEAIVRELCCKLASFYSRFLRNIFCSFFLLVTICCL